MKSFKFQIISFVLLFLLPVCISSQNYNVDVIKKEEGLSQSIILCGLEDSRGFFWFGTVNGLNRYDGKEFVVFNHNQFDATSISYNKIIGIAEDKNGFIWIATAKGKLDKLDPRTGKSKNYKISDEVFGTESFISITIFTNYDGKLWAMTQKIDGKTTFKYYNVLTDKFETYKTGINYIDSILKKSPVSPEIFVGKDGVLIIKIMDLKELRHYHIGSEFFRSVKLIVLNTRKNTIKIINRYKDYEYVKFLGKDENGDPLIQIASEKDRFKIIKLVLDKNIINETDFRIDKKWLTKGFSLNPFYYNYKMFATVKFRNKNVNKKNNKFNGLYQFNDSGYLEFNKRIQIHSLFPTYSGFSIQKKIFSLSNNIIWDFQDNGLIKIIPKIKKVQTYKNIKSDANSISDNIIRSVYIDKDNVLWVGTYNGLNKFDANNSRWIHYSNNTLNPDYSKNIFNAIIDGDNNNLFLGTNNGVFLFNKKNGMFTDYSKSHNLSKHLKNELSNNIWGLLFINNELWIGSLLGLYKNELGTNSFKAYSPSDTKANSISDDRVSIIYKDKNNNIWLGTQNGLNRYLPELDGFKAYLNNPADSNSLCGNNIWSLCEDKTGNLWIGSYGAGINKYNPITDNFTHITTKNGLPDDGIVSMACDKENNLWLGSMNGLIKYDQKTKIFTRYSEHDGFQGDEYSFHSVAVTQDNNLVFGGLNGVSIFSPKDLQKNKNMPKIVISKLFFEDSLASYFLQDGDTIKTDWKTNYIKVQFSAMDYIAPLLNQYAFKIDGLHKDWIFLGNQNSIILAGIDPGEFTLRIKASNNDGVWNEKGISIHISIIPPFWLTLWFKTFSFLIIFFIISFFIFDRFRRRREKDRAKRRIISLQLKALQAQMNPHFIFNSLNAILNLIVQDEKQKAMQYLSKFSKLLRKVIERSRASTITLEQEIEQIKLYFELEQLRFDNK
ncbi:MAG: two-component regulator propeller domain-containing protein, partial [Bacteroidota bacterium]